MNSVFSRCRALKRVYFRCHTESIYQVWICNLVWEQSEVPEDWRKAIIVPLYTGRGKGEECNNYRAISLLSVPGKIYGRILNERMMKITDMSVDDEQVFLKGRGCVDQIFAVKTLVEKYLEKEKEEKDYNDDDNNYV